jgi:two-component system chemotaxis response regulator CheB
MSEPIRVLVVDDSALIRQMLTRALGQDAGIEVVGTAGTGLEAVEKALELEPDVVTLDVEMPDLNGLEALRFLRAKSDARVVMLTSLDGPDIVYQALSSGAVDFISKPKRGVASSLGEFSEVVIEKIKTAYRADPAAIAVATEAAGRVVGECRPRDDARPSAPSCELDALVTIAASTGGPPALEAVLSQQSVSLPAAYMIVQHLPKGFHESLARRLSQVTDLDVRVAVSGEPIVPGVAYLAPHGTHMMLYRVEEGTLRVGLEEGPHIHGVRPAADPLMISAAAAYPSVMGVVLSGMGSDGVAGLRAIHAAGGRTIAQDEATSVVWGMPGTAVKEGVVSEVVPLDLVGVEVRRALQGEGAA